MARCLVLSEGRGVGVGSFCGVDCWSCESTAEEETEGIRIRMCVSRTGWIYQINHLNYDMLSPIYSFVNAEALTNV